MDIKPVIKKYWPWMLGGVAGLYLITRMSGGAATGGGVITGGTDAATMQLAMQAQQMQASNNLALASLASTTGKQNNDAQVQNILAQGAMAGQIGASAAGLITALNVPAITAINSANDLNKQAVNAAAAIAIGGYTSQAAQLQAAADAAGNYAGSMALMNVAVSNATKAANDAIVGQQNALRPVVGPNSTSDSSSAIKTIAGLAALML